MEELKAALYLIPCGMSGAPLSDVMPEGNLRILRSIRHFIVENVREARRFIKRCDPGIDISALTFHELNRHTDPAEVSGYLEALRRGLPMGVISDAGCPAVADPGALPVSIAQREGFRVVPLVGPSSILLAIMASGFNGQGFAFHGYLPIADAGRVAALKRLESDSRRNDMTQLFIETPYRNNRMLRLLAETLAGDTKICVACDLTDPERESVRSMTAARWRELLKKADRKEGEENAVENYDKRPAVFLIYAGDGAGLQLSKKARR